MSSNLSWRRRRRSSYWVVESPGTTLEVRHGRSNGAITLIVRGPLVATTLQHDGVAQRELSELSLTELRFAGGSGVAECLRRWAHEGDDVEVSLGYVTDAQGEIRAASLSGVISDEDGNDILFGDPDAFASR